MDIVPEYRPGHIRATLHTSILSIDAGSWDAFERDPDGSPIPAESEPYPSTDLIYAESDGVIYRSVQAVASITLADLAIWLQENLDEGELAAFETEGDGEGEPPANPYEW